MVKTIIKNQFVVTTLALLLFSNTTFSQKTDLTPQNVVNELIDYANTIYGADDRLINGQTYRPINIRAKGHPYFLTSDWMDATLFIKSVEFKGVKLKYNIENDEIILRREFEEGMVTSLLLNKDFIDSIYIDKHTLINTSILPLQNTIGFAEQIHKGHLITLLKHEVSFKEESVDAYIFGMYLKPKKTLYIYNKNQLVRIKNKKAFFKYFSPQKKDIIKFMRKNHITFKNANNNQLHNLLNYCNELLSTSEK